MNSTLISAPGGGVLAYYCARAMTSAAGASMSSTTSTANGAPAPYAEKRTWNAARFLRGSRPSSGTVTSVAAS